MAIIGKDYRGLRLCEPCWNGKHFTIATPGHPSRCACNDSRCECPCSKMKDALAAATARRQEPTAKNKAAQMDIADPGTGYSHVNPDNPLPKWHKGWSKHRRSVAAKWLQRIKP